MPSNIYFFNPTCEPAIANGSPFYTAPARLRKFEADLGYLPVWLGEESDQVLVQGAVVRDFHLRMKSLGFRLPEVINVEQALKDSSWIQEPKGRLYPWGWSPAVYQLFKPIFPSFCEEFQQSAIAGWKNGHQNLFSRLTGVSLLERIVDEGETPWLTDKSSVPEICNTLEEIYLKIDSHTKSVVKTPWSSSGRGLLLFPNPDSTKKNEEVLNGMLKQQGFVTVEPWLNKVLDLSYQFYSQSGVISYMGRSIFETDPKGRYVRNFLTTGSAISNEVSCFLENHDRHVVDSLLSKLSQSGYSNLYEGWIGVDAMIFKSHEGDLKFHPVVEINGRFTMGAVALKVRESIASGSDGFLSIFYSKRCNFLEFAKQQESEMPLVMKGHKMVSGFLPLTPPLAEHSFGAYVEVKRY